MIEHLSGTLIEREEDRLIIDVNGVGYGVGVSRPTGESVGTVGSAVRLWIITRVREEELSLFGFSTRAERDAFEVITGISGAGPRLALALLSTYPIAELIQIVLAGDAARLKRVPGVGAKKAERLLLELKGRVDRLSSGLGPEAGRLVAESAAGAGEPALDTSASPVRDAIEALESLDLPPTQARRAIARAVEELGPDAATEDLIREGLKHRRG